MHRFLLLAAALVLVGCPTDDDPPFNPGVADDDDDGGDDDDFVEDLGPEGWIRGYVVDGDGAPRPGIPVTELDSEPPNAANSDDDGVFLLEPSTWSPAQIWAGDEGFMEVGLVLNEDSYLGIGQPVEMELLTREDAEAFIAETFEFEWTPETGAVIALITTPTPEDMVGISATLEAPGVGPYYFDADGVAILGGSIPVADSPGIAWVGVGHGPATLEVTANPGMTCAYPADFVAQGNAFLFVPVSCH